MIKDDPVNNPDHYTTGGIDTIDYIKAKLIDEELAGYLKGSVIKYISRSKYKDNEIQDLQKAFYYLNDLCMLVDKKNENG